MEKYLPEKFKDKVYFFGEWSYGVNKITVILQDGRKIHNVKISGLRIHKVGEGTSIDFDPAKIIDVIDEVL